MCDCVRVRGGRSSVLARSSSPTSPLSRASSTAAAPSPQPPLPAPPAAWPHPPPFPHCAQLQGGVKALQSQGVLPSNVTDLEVRACVYGRTNTHMYEYKPRISLMMQVRVWVWVWVCVCVFQPACLSVCLAGWLVVYLSGVKRMGGGGLSRTAGCVPLSRAVITCEKPTLGP